MANLMLRALIADDEPLARALVREYLADHADITIVAEASTGLEAVRCIQEQAPDLVFLDVQMPRLTGLEVLQLTGLRSGVVFTTAHDRHALEAFDLHAVDYLLKPFTQERFDAALQRARKLSSSEAGGGTSPVERLVGAQPLRRVLVRDGTQMHVLPLEEVDYIQAQADQVAFHHQGRDHLKAQGISELEAQLEPGRFVRVHRSFLVNIAQIASVERTESQAHALRLRSGKRIPVSRSGYDKLKEVL